MNRRRNEQKEREGMEDRKLEKGERASDSESRCKIHGEHLSRNIYESVAGNETDAEERGRNNGRERAARLE